MANSQCDAASLVANTWDCLPLDQKERRAFVIIQFLANEVVEAEIDITAEPPCVWNRFSEREKWSVILYALCALLQNLDRDYQCSICESELPNDFLALGQDDKLRAWLSLLTLFSTLYAESEEEYAAFIAENDQPCRDHQWRVNVLLNIALQFLDTLQLSTDPDVIMCGDTNPYLNVKLQDVPAWLFKLFCTLFLQLSED